MQCNILKTCMIICCNVMFSCTIMFTWSVQFMIMFLISMFSCTIMCSKWFIQCNGHVLEWYVHNATFSFTTMSSNGTFSTMIMCSNSTFNLRCSTWVLWWLHPSWLDRSLSHLSLTSCTEVESPKLPRRERRLWWRQLICQMTLNVKELRKST